MDWLQALRELPEGAVWVQHRPLTPRYVRAALKLASILRSAVLLGLRRAERLHHTELATWSPPADGRGCGYYCCFRVFGSATTRVDGAVLFCFYDGRDLSPGFRSLSAAHSFAQSEGFQEDPHALYH